MLSTSLRLRGAAFRCSAAAARQAVQCNARRCYSSQGPRPSRFQNSKKAKAEVLERDRPQTDYSPHEQQQRQQGGWWQQEQQTTTTQPASSFPSYVDQHERRREEQQGSQWDHLSMGVVDHMRKVYATLATGIGIAAGASLFTMATPLIGVSPMIPAVASIVPLMGLMYTNKHQHSQTMRAGLFAAFTGLAGMSMAPLLFVAMKVAPMAVPQALLITTGLFGTMTALSLFAKPGATLRLGVPLGAGMIVLALTGVASIFVPVTSAWYPLLHNIYLYGGLALFTAYIAYDTQNMIAEYEMGQDDHLKHAVDLFINFKAIFMRVLSLLMMRDD